MTSTASPVHDFIVIGSGILGMATARQLQQQFPGCRLVVLEKEPGPARHQSGRNSGVIHAGVYYAPGSLKARYCKLGNAMTKDYCRQHGIPFEECGKLIVAANEAELDRMQALVKRCHDNDIDIEVLDEQQLRQSEAAINGIGAIFVPSSGIVDYAEVCSHMGEMVEASGGDLRFDHEVGRIEEARDEVTVTTDNGQYSGRYVVACAGLQSDRIAAMLRLDPEFRIVPFRGEYFQLPERHNQIVRHLIYPVPDPGLPFLGVHLTRMIDGSVTVGPNAVLAFSREGYRRADFSIGDTIAMLAYPGTARALSRHLRAGIAELRNSFSRTAYLRQVQKYCPELELTDLLEYPAGVRAQAVSKSGELIDDFLFMNTARSLVVCNAPSPAATSAMPISEHIVKNLRELMTD